VVPVELPVRMLTAYVPAVPTPVIKLNVCDAPGVAPANTLTTFVPAIVAALEMLTVCPAVEAPKVKAPVCVAEPNAIVAAAVAVDMVKLPADPTTIPIAPALAPPIVVVPPPELLIRVFPTIVVAASVVRPEIPTVPVIKVLPVVFPNASVPVPPAIIVFPAPDAFIFAVPTCVNAASVVSPVTPKVVEKVPEEKEEAPVTPSVVENVPDVKVDAPVTPSVVENVPDVADKAAIVDAPVTDKVVEKAPEVADSAAIVEDPVTDKVVENAPEVADNAASVVAPVTPNVVPIVAAPVVESVVAATGRGVVLPKPPAGGAAKTAAKLDGCSAVFGFGDVPKTALVSVSRNTIPC